MRTRPRGGAGAVTHTPRCARRHRSPPTPWPVTRTPRCARRHRSPPTPAWRRPATPPPSPRPRAPPTSRATIHPSPRHRMPFNSTSEGSQRVSMTTTWRAVLACPRWAWQISPATSQDAAERDKRGFETRVDEAAAGETRRCLGAPLPRCGGGRGPAAACPTQ